MAADEKQSIVIKKKKKGGHAGHHGGAWKVAFADFMTAMMAFFMVMWLMSSDLETAKEIEAYFRTERLTRDGISANGDFNGGDTQDNIGADGRFEEKDLSQPHYVPPVYIEEYSILKDLSSFYEGAAFSTDVEGDWVKYTITPRVHFKKGSSVIPSDMETRTLLVRLIGVFKQHDGTIVVEGFADDKQDWNLSYKRALNIVKVLEKSGVSSSRLIPKAGMQLRKDGDGLENISKKDSGTVQFILKRKRY